MNNRPVPELQTDPEFEDLIQPREENYLEELEESIFDHRVVWILYMYGTISYLTVICDIRSV